MERFSPLAILGCAVVVVGGCAAPQTRTPSVEAAAAELEAKKQQELVLTAFVDANERLYRVGYPLLSHGTPLCKDKVRYDVGMWTWNSHMLPDSWKEAAASLYGVSNVVQVMYVAPGSPAAAAGIQPGDVPVMLGEWEVPVGPAAVSKLKAAMEEETEDGSAVIVRLRRGQEYLTVAVQPEAACAFDLVLDNSDIKNAHADGERIVVNRGLMDFFASDEEAATVISHELAHDAMGHTTAKKTNAAIGGVLGFAVDIAAAAMGVNTQGTFTDIGMKAGAGAYSVEFEQEADYVGLYFMSLGGYEVDAAPNLWRRMAVQNPKSIQLKTTHPTSPERFIGLEKTVAEIDAKRARGAALQPEMKPKPEFTAPAPEDHSSH